MRHYIYLPFLVILLIFFCFIISACNHNVKEYSLPKGINLQTGDIVFRSGRSIESNVVMSLDNKSVYSHIGIIIWYNQEWSVMHAVPNERKGNEKDSVKMEPVGVFFRKDRASSGVIYRVLESAKDTLALMNRCKEIYNSKPLFDDSFSLEDTTSFYCTELVWHIYKTALDMDLSQSKRHKVPMLPPMIFCSDIIDYPNLSLVYQFKSTK